MANFGTQNLQEYKMANGFLSQLAAAQVGQQASGGLAGLQLRRTGLEEMRTIEDEIRTMEEKLSAEEESARKREGRSGRGRLVGGLVGGLAALATGGGSLALAAGTGLGSAAGQELGARYSLTRKGVETRKRHLDRIRGGLKPGLFHSGAIKDVELKRKDLNRFLRDADRQFDERIISGALTDALSAYTFGETDLGKHASREKGLIKGWKAKKKADQAKAAMSASGIGSKSFSDLGLAWNDPSDFKDILDAFNLYKEQGALKRGETIHDFMSGFNLPGQGFGNIGGVI